MKCALTFQVPNSIYQFWIESNYLNVVKSAAMSVLGSPREIKFRAADSGMTGPVVDAHADGASEPLASIHPRMRIRRAPSTTG